MAPQTQTQPLPHQGRKAPAGRGLKYDSSSGENLDIFYCCHYGGSVCGGEFYKQAGRLSREGSFKLQKIINGLRGRGFYTESKK